MPGEQQPHVVVIADRFGAAGAPAADPTPQPGGPPIPNPSWVPAASAAAALVEGWRSAAPGVRVSGLGASDGSAGYLTALRELLGGPGDAQDVAPVVVEGPLGEPVPAEVLLAHGAEATGAQGVVAYIETAQAAGAHLLARPRDRSEISSRGVGELVAAALDAGAPTVVVGVGGLVCHDGGAGLLAALAGVEDDAWVHGLARLDEIEAADVPRVLAAALERVGSTRVVLAHDRPLPLLGFSGVSATVGAGTSTGPTPAIPPERTQHWENVLGRWADLLDRALPLPVDLLSGRTVRRGTQPGSGAGGGVGTALLALGASATDAAEDVLRRGRLEHLLADAALVLLACPRYSWTELDSGLAAATVAAAAARAVPVVLLADELTVGRREVMSHGLSATYPLRARGALGAPTPADLVAAGARLATTWTPSR